jgi:peptidoglycan/xylan/chitin deacetylase (PgdA/CDA1 family)
VSSDGVRVRLREVCERGRKNGYRHVDDGIWESAVTAANRRAAFSGWDVPVVTVPVLMYHSATDTPTAETRALSVPPRALGRQLRRLKDHGFTGLTFGELCARRRNGAVLPERPVVLTFDDGYADLHEQVLPILVEYGFPATVFITSGWLRDAGARAADNRPPDRMLSWSQLVELSDNGIEIGAHSHSHPQLDQIDRARLRAELVDSRALLEDRLGRSAPSLAYPYGYSNALVRETAREAGYSQAAGVTNTTAGPQADPFRVPRLTIRRSTSDQRFADISDQRLLWRHYAIARALTTGWSVVRATRSKLQTRSEHR